MGTEIFVFMHLCSTQSQSGMDFILIRLGRHVVLCEVGIHTNCWCSAEHRSLAVHARSAPGCQELLFSLSAIKCDLSTPLIKLLLLQRLLDLCFPHLVHILYQIIRMHAFKKMSMLLLDIKSCMEILTCTLIIEIPRSFQ